MHVNRSMKDGMQTKRDIRLLYLIKFYKSNNSVNIYHKKTLK